MESLSDQQTPKARKIFTKPSDLTKLRTRPSQDKTIFVEHIHIQNWLLSADKDKMKSSNPISNIVWLPTD